MKIMGLYKHKYNTDIALCILKSFYVQQGDYYKLKIEWFNIVNPNNIFTTGVKENLKIDRSTFLKDWDYYL